ncbi:hypothetical protein L7E55_04595 [Pelotomaculum isophthalicicum JI]|uniref:Uncharacterized protein n=1 Tax=Pelotomaculum isophthalicicum JI TaxID=947010 RepID=A0A9X4H4X7_9FIRM|nr:hypothetical protein [Pelotomaculum isophthalicicum]MDF9407643.1 hypothetical protein [Pelotomaculum isophthalicicum JI]
MFFMNFTLPRRQLVKDSTIKTNEEKKELTEIMKPSPNFEQIQPGLYCFSFSSTADSGTFPVNRQQLNLTPFKQQKHYPAEAPEKIPGTRFVKADDQQPGANSLYDLPLYCFT